MRENRKRLKTTINPEKKVVTVVFKPKDLIREVGEESSVSALYRDIIQYSMITGNPYESVFGNDKGKKFVGIARCMGDDFFDEKFGEALAMNKAEQKYHKDAAKIYSRTYDVLIKAADWCKKFQEYHELEQYCSERKIADAQEI